ncbi:head maturation protease, ClpP-related [Lacrimispora indolis]|uniref:head maturation protease, ClpP-related n=1 Tax=Lacrimispora indolis TaxID=69825 RepID=UPI0004100014|nr:head maturation protease, ClpP-related [[Clostridium] methoxybenzovorans]
MKTIMIKGPIISNGEKWIYDWFEEDSTCPNDVIKALPDDNSEVTVIINSGGGYVDCGNEIYTALKSYAGKVIVDIIEAASAASVIAMAGDTIRITPVGQLMIHNVSCISSGDYHTMDKTSEILQKANQSISSAYQLKTGLSQEELLAMMDKETRMTAEEAKEKGFVDEILFQKEEGMILVANCKELLPQNIISTMQKWKNGENSLQSMIRQEVEKAMKQSNENSSDGIREPEKHRNRFFFI